MKTYIIIGAAALVTIVVLSTAYEAFVTVPRERIAQQEKERVLEAEREAQRQANLDQCLEDAYTLYSADWDQHCETIGREAECTLPGVAASTFNERYYDDKDRCVTMYK